jgi:hypothetical protein
MAEVSEQKKLGKKHKNSSGVGEGVQEEGGWKWIKSCSLRGRKSFRKRLGRAAQVSDLARCVLLKSCLNTCENYTDLKLMVTFLKQKYNMDYITLAILTAKEYTGTHFIYNYTLPHTTIATFINGRHYRYCPCRVCGVQNMGNGEKTRV